MAPSHSSRRSGSRSSIDDPHEALASLRLSQDGEPNGSPVKPEDNPSMNGMNGSGVHHGGSVEFLQNELERERREKETLASQYQNLVSRLNTMRTTLGTKLKQDAEELDRREQLIQQLTARNDDLSSTVETLQAEVLESNNETERAQKELKILRNRALETDEHELLVREREQRELQIELERCRVERDEREREASEAKLSLDEMKTVLENVRRDLELERDARQRAQESLESEQEKTSNLQSVLEDFQAAKDNELIQATRERDTQLTQVTQALAEYKHRAHTAEMKLEELSTDGSRTAALEKEVKEKNLLIGKLRHEAVIMNEHLMEALRRLRKNTSENSVDRRLVTNVLLSFLTTPRADGKRFEMLNLLATILAWNDAEREKAGLQRSALASSSSWGARSVSNPKPSLKGRAPEIENNDETESFSQRWVEFLLKEASAGLEAGSPNSPKSPPRSNVSLPGSPKSGQTSPGPRQLRLSSFTHAGMVSSPNLGSHHQS